MATIEGGDGGGTEKNDDLHDSGQGKTTIEPENNEMDDDTVNENKKISSDSVEEKENKQKTGEDTKVDLSRLQPKYKPLNKSNLQNVLVDYGMPKDETIVPKRIKKKITSKDRSFGDSDKEKLKQKKEHYLQVYNDIYRLKELYYEQYSNALRTRIEEQREEIKKKNEALEKHIRNKELTKKERNKASKPKATRHNLIHDDSFLKRLPKTQYYKIVSLVDKMRSEGKLKTQTELDVFWKHIQQPHIYEQYFPPSIHSSATPGTTIITGPGSHHGISHPTKSNASSLTESPTRPYPPQHPPHPPIPSLAGENTKLLDQITEDKEPSRPQTRQSPTRQSPTRQDWAVTQQVQHRNKRSGSPGKKSDPYNVAKQAALELEKIFPPMELPKLHCFVGLDLGKDTPDPEEILKELQAKQRENERRVHIKKLRKMYQLALSNTASAQRILDKHAGEPGLALKGPTVADLAFARAIEPDYSEDDDKGYLYQEDGELDVPGTTFLTQEFDLERPWTKHLRPRQINPIEEVPEDEGSTDKATRKTSAKSKTPSAKSSHRSASTPVKVQPMPLSLDAVSSGGKLMEAKCQSTLWVNYTRIGLDVK